MVISSKQTRGQNMERLENPTLPETGCYVEGGWGWRGTSHLVEQFAGWFYTLDAEDEQILADYERGEDDSAPEIAYDLAQEAEDMINAALPDNLIAHWHDGEFYVSPYCGNDYAIQCGSETCYCQLL